MSATVYSVLGSYYVTITVHNHEVIERVTGPGGDEWRSQFYPTIETAENVIEHFAYNAIANHVHDISRLDGWCDCNTDDVLIEVDGLDVIVEDMTLPPALGGES